MIKKVVDFFISTQIQRQDENSMHNSRLFVKFILVTVFFAPFYSLVSYCIDFIPGAIIMAACTIIHISLLLLFKKFGKINTFGNLYVGTGSLAIFLVVYFSGGIISNVMPWFTVPPILAMLLINKKSGLIWGGICLLGIIVYAIADCRLYAFPLAYNQSFASEFMLTTHAGLLLIILAITMVYEAGKTDLILKIRRRNSEIEMQKDIIEKEKLKSDKLLLSILPLKVADELKRFGKTKAQRYELVTVLFADFKNFTEIAESLSPEELITYINHCFTAFDKIIEKYQIEKIKTIGDAYMCAGGIPSPNKTNPVDVVSAALEIQQFMKTLKLHDSLQFEVRIGIHTGPIIAGIVGLKKFSYDIWGETVNTASFLESSSEVGKVAISERTYEFIKHQFECSYRGNLQAKGKNQITIYYVENHKASSTQTNELISVS